MDNETILKLVNAGYTKEEIEKIETVGGGNGAGAAENGAGENAGNENEGAGKIEGNAGAENAGAVNTDAAIKALTDTVNALTNTVKAMQEKNAATATGGKPEKTGVDEVMKSFIDAL